MSIQVLVTGATGNIGSHLVMRLVGRDDVQVREFVRDEGKTVDIKDATAEIAVGTFENAATVDAAVQGVDTVVLITTPNANASAQASTVIGAAKKAGVKKIVRVSAVKASLEGPTDNTRQHGTDRRRDPGVRSDVRHPSTALLHAELHVVDPIDRR